jgi:hypothetical protein
MGYSTKEFMGKNLFAECILDKLMAGVQSVLDQALQGEERANFQCLLMTKSGTHLEVLFNATTSRNEQRNVIAIVGIKQETTGCLAQEREYTHSIGTAFVPIFGGHTLGWVNIRNKCAFHLIEYSADKVIGCRYRFSGKPISTYMSLTLARLCGEWCNGRTGVLA